MELAFVVGLGIIFAIAIEGVANRLQNVWIALVLKLFVFLSPQLILYACYLLKLIMASSVRPLSFGFAVIQGPVAVFALAKARRAYLDNPEKYAFSLGAIALLDKAIYVGLICLVVYWLIKD